MQEDLLLSIIVEQYHWFALNSEAENAFLLLEIARAHKISSGRQARQFLGELIEVWLLVKPDDRSQVGIVFQERHRIEPKSKIVDFHLKGGETGHAILANRSPADFTDENFRRVDVGLYLGEYSIEYPLSGILPAGRRLKNGAIVNDVNEEHFFKRARKIRIPQDENVCSGHHTLIRALYRTNDTAIHAASEENALKGERAKGMIKGEAPSRSPTSIDVDACEED